MLFALAPTLGNAGIRTRTADFSKFYAAQRLKLDDTGRGGGDRSVKRSVTISDPRTVAQVNRLLRSVAADWKPVPWTPPFPQFTFFAVKDEKVTDWMWFDAPSGESGRAYVQMKLPGAGMYYTYISEKDFDRLLILFGVLEWRNGPGDKGDEGR
jgi:hypothetical protein